MDEKNNSALKWVILCSGWGANAVDVIEEYSNSLSNSYKIALIIYESENCGAAQTAKKQGIETLKIKRSDYKDAKTHQLKLIEEIKNRDIEHIFMMNYKYLIRGDMLLAFPNKIVNVHPSLFPSFLGTKTAIQDALSYGVKITGITTHIIDNQYDRGIIICQESIRIKANDDFDSLYPRFRKKGKKIILKTLEKVTEKSKKYEL